ncbi:MAG: type II secretion system protein [Candidatus Nomurabacteria bacterium]|nr:type II secretion system protein [Candidatus Nomurabacteria bacterium]
MNKNKGFTLIELLVVIAIIGILSSVVLASLNTARTKGSDAAVKSNLSNMRAQAELQYNEYGCYTVSGACNATTPAAVAAGACVATASTLFAQTNISSAITSALNAGGGLSSCKSSVGGGAWATIVQEKSATKSWCVDSTGASKEITIPASPLQSDLDGHLSTGACV